MVLVSKFSQITRESGRQVAGFLALALLAFGAGLGAGLGVRVAAAICGTVVFGILLLRMPILAAGTALFGVLLLGSIEAPRLFGITITNVSLAVCIIVLATRHLWISRSKDVPLRLPFWTLVFVLMLLGGSNVSAVFSSLSTPLLVGFLSLFLAKQAPRLLLSVLGIIGLVHAGVGLFESATHSSLVYTDWKDASAADISGIRRAASTVGDPNYLALTLLCAAPGVFSVVRRWKPMLRYIALGGYVTAFVLTFSRGVFLAALAAAFIYFMLTRSGQRRIGRTVAFGLAGVAIVTVFVVSPLGQSFIDRFTSLDASSRQRAVIQAAAFELFQQNWITGLGFGELSTHLAPLAQALVPLNASGVRAFLPQSDPLNTYLLIGAEGGIAALIVVVGLLGYAAVRSYRKNPGLTATVVGLGIAGVTLDLVQLPVIWCLLTFSLHYSSNQVHQARRVSQSQLLDGATNPEVISANGLLIRALPRT